MTKTQTVLMLLLAVGLQMSATKCAFAQGPEQPGPEQEPATQQETPAVEPTPQVVPLQGRAGMDVTMPNESNGGFPSQEFPMTPPAMAPPPYQMPPQSEYVMPPDMVPQQMPPGALLQQQTPNSDTPSNGQQPHAGLLGNVFKTLLNGGVKKNVPPAERPWWMPGNAYTNDNMVAPYHNMDIFWWDKRPMPSHSQMVRLAPSVTRFWRGPVIEPCFVLVEPLPQAPGNFTFRSRSYGGPRGWLQALSVPDESGFPQYRYWLDQ